MSPETRLKMFLKRPKTRTEKNLFFYPKTTIFTQKADFHCVCFFFHDTPLETLYDTINYERVLTRLQRARDVVANRRVPSKVTVTQLKY